MARRWTASRAAARTRSWLYRIATNTCLDAIAKRPKRILPIDNEQPVVEGVWLEPFPDELLDDDGWAAPEARYEARESIELAFIAALQHLPANQRAVLILREVLGFSAKEVAGMLDTTPASVNSAMQRARASVDERLPERSQQETLRSLDDEQIRELVERYIDAWDRGDVDAVVAMLAEEATFSMPPNAEWFRGREAIREFLPRGPLSIPRRFVRTRANGQLAFGTYKLIDGEWLPNAIHVITLDAAGEITDASAFLDAVAVPALRAADHTPPDRDKLGGVPIDGARTIGCHVHEASSPLRRPVAPAPASGGRRPRQPDHRTGALNMAISPPAPLAGAPLSRRLADTQSSPVRELLEQAMQPHIISLAGGLPAPDTFDVEGLRAAFDEVLSGPDAIRALQYSTTEGDPALRERLAAFMCTRGLEVTGDDLLITTGSQQALGLVASALLDPGDTILVEDPTYLAALQTFQLADLRAHADPRRRRGPRSRRADRAGPRDRRQGRLPDPDLPEPDRPHDRPPSAAPRWPRPPPPRACGWSRTTRTARCAWTATTSTCWPPSPPRATARSSSRRCRRSSRPACGSATCARPPRCAGR